MSFLGSSFQSCNSKGQAENAEQDMLIKKRFISETELGEIKKKREEEWTKAREEGREICEEEPEIQDCRSLYEKLQDQKNLKQEEIDEKLKFKNMIYKGLDNDESDFLAFVATKKAEIDKKRFDEESEELKGYRAAVEEAISTESTNAPTASKANKSTIVAKASKSQADLLMGGIRKKRTSSDITKDEAVIKKAKFKGDEEKEDNITKLNNKDKNTKADSSVSQINPGTYSLAGLAAYSDSDDSSD